MMRALSLCLILLLSACALPQPTAEPIAVEADAAIMDADVEARSAKADEVCPNGDDGIGGTGCPEPVQ